MARKFTVKHKSAGIWSEGDVVTDEQVQANHFDLQHWLDVKAVEPFVEPATEPPHGDVAAQDGGGPRTL